MDKHITIMMTDGRIETHGEILFDPAEGVLHVLSAGGARASFNWRHIQFFSVHECEDEDEE